jgi:hypothetical protein
MKLLLEGWLHHKNEIGIKLMRKNGLDVYFKFDRRTKYDCIINTSKFTQYENHNGKLIIGPHIDIIDINKQLVYFEQKCYFNCLSNWNVNIHKSLINSDKIKFISLPFAVDIQKFMPKEKNGKPVIYFKKVDKNRLNDVLNHFGEKFILFDCEKKYKENDFFNAISRAPYCIWIGSHESQGFALQETLSSNTPIFVINVRTLREEINSKWVDFMPEQKLEATAAPYFDDSCGIISFPERWKEDWLVFIKNIINYTPRDYIVNTLSPINCVKIWEGKIQRLK